MSFDHPPGPEERLSYHHPLASLLLASWRSDSRIKRLFAQKFGVMLCDGPLAGLLARAVIIIDRDRRIAYRELVEEITHEPDYDAALSVLRSLAKS